MRFLAMIDRLSTPFVYCAVAKKTKLPEDTNKWLEVQSIFPANAKGKYQ